MRQHHMQDCHFTERKVAEYFVDAVLQDPTKSISVWGDGEELDLSKSKAHFEILDTMGACDLDELVVYDEEKKEHIAGFVFIYGNVTSTSDPLEVISDYSANEYADQIIAKVEEMTK